MDNNLSGPSIPFSSDFELPLIVLKYDKWKILGRFIFAWGPVAVVSASMMNRAFEKSSLSMLVAFLLMFLGIISYHVQLLNMKELQLYHNRIVKVNRLLTNNTIIELHNSKFSFIGGWLEEVMLITGLTQKKSLFIFNGYMRRSELNRYFEILSLITTRTPEYFSSGWDKFFLADPAPNRTATS